MVGLDWVRSVSLRVGLGWVRDSGLDWVGCVILQVGLDWVGCVSLWAGLDWIKETRPTAKSVIKCCLSDVFADSVRSSLTCIVIVTVSLLRLVSQPCH